MYNCLTVVFLSIPSDIERDLIGIIYRERVRERMERDRKKQLLGEIGIGKQMYINSIAQRRLCDHLS